MKKIKYHMDLGSMIACMKIMMESTNGLGKRYIKEDTHFFSF